MSKTAEDAQNTAADLPVEVQVKLAESTISLHQLEALRPGDRLPIKTSFPAAQAISAGGAFADVEIIESSGCPRLRVSAVSGDW